MCILKENWYNLIFKFLLKIFIIIKNINLFKQKKPLNLINYFMNLLLSPEAYNKAEYLKFLSSICNIGDKGISVNQEIIYKFFVKIS